MSRLTLACGRVLVTTVIGALGACGGAGAEDSNPTAGDWRAETDTIGDTIVVRTVSGSEWGTAHLVEELRIGVADGPEHLAFGQIAAIAVRSNGEILVHDEQATALRRFGPDGSYLGTLSRAGSGPGEYRYVAGLAVLPDDRLVVHDFGNHRFNLYSADTTYLATWLHATSVAEWRPTPTHDGAGIYAFDQVRPEGSRSEERILVRLDEKGIAHDTTRIRLAERETPGMQVRSATRSFGTLIPFHPLTHWSVTPAGELVTADGALYAVDLHRPDGKVVRLTRSAGPVAVSPEERAAEEERITERFRRLVPTWTWDGPRIPETKPPISWLHTGRDGSVWVRIAQPGSVVPPAERAPSARSFVNEPLVFDVFEADGRYEGQVRGRDGLQLLPYPVLDRDRVWAVWRDPNGVDFVVRFRIVRD